MKSHTFRINKFQHAINICRRSLFVSSAGLILATANVYASDTTYQLNIEPQTLSTAITELSAATQQHITADGVALAEQRTIQVKGNYTTEKALEILLKGSGFVATKVGENRFSIHEVGAALARDNEIERIAVTGSYVVNEPIDTATGLGLTLQETPQTVNIITRQSIEDQALTSLTDVINNASGISAKAYDSSRNAFSSRGFNVDNYQIDGVPVQWNGAQSAGESLTDTALYERIEIVRGATGLLTGAGDPSASINLVRKHANSSELSGKVIARLGRWNNYYGSVDLGTGLNESGSVRGRTVMVLQEGDSFVDYEKKSKQVFYATVDADLSNATLLRLGYSIQDNEPKGSQWGGLPIFNSDLSRTDFDRSASVAAKWSSWASTHKTFFANLHHSFSNGWELVAHANKNVSTADMYLLWVSGLPHPVTGAGMKASASRLENEREQVDFGVRLQGMYSLFDREHEFVVGAAKSDQDFVYYGYEGGGSKTAKPVTNFFEWNGEFDQPDWGQKYISQDYTTEQTGYFAATRIHLSDKFKAIVGARLASWNRQGVSYGKEQDYGDDDVFIPYAGFLYSLTDSHTIYTSYTEIFKPQNAVDADDNYLDPLTGINYEIGLKSTYFNDALHTNITYFQTQQENLAVVDPDFVPRPDKLAAYKEADGVESDGYELEVVGQIMDGWKINANYTAFEATAEDSSGTSNTVNTRFPRKIFRLFNTFEYNQFTLGAGISWEGENYTDIKSPLGNVRVEQPAYSLINLMARYQHNEALSVQLNIDNAFDKEYYSQIGFYSQLAYGEPRNISLSLHYKL
ncbi:TonB-dependent siderophore receptor [Pseudoalteromonas sp. HM-SA03]|uniref:TonB-dependent siderophore receptor n=1 Tax=Pseudoalteromonas sp. HM-SA03 TaxID=2029678 RepID=UPI000BADEB12|nr:TonB-dependent receptor [Pseudoalteromonas sp. HM-SA03]PAY01657.1 TonB-dependent siderophore receptor [Pseudoalteromonas sp. HM-SA03]